MGLDRYFESQRMGLDPLLGHPVVDDTMDLGGPASFGARVLFQRWLANQRARRGSRIGFDDDLGGDDEDAAELGADMDDDLEIEDLGAAPYDEDLGGLDDRIRRLQDKRRNKNSRLARARTSIRRRFLMHQIEKIDRKIAELKAQQKQVERVTRGGRGGGQTQRGGAGGPGSLRAGRANLDLGGRWQGIQPAGRMVKVNALAGGDTMVNGNFPAASAVGSQITWSFTTSQITYASFRVLGVEVTGYIAGDDGSIPYTWQTWPSWGQLSVVVETLQADGYPNLIYGDQQMALNGSNFGNSSTNLFDGVRDNSLVRRNNTVTVSGYVTNPFALPATAGVQLDFALQVGIMLDVVEDDVFEPGND